MKMNGEGLVLSEIHSHHSRQQSPDHNHLTSNHPHLQSLISTPISTRFSLTRIVRSTVYHPKQLPDSNCTNLCVTYPVVSQNYSCDPPALTHVLPGTRFQLSCERNSIQFPAVSLSIGLCFSHSPASLTSSSAFS